MVERMNPGREVGGQFPSGHRVVSLSKIHLPPKSTGNTRKRRFHPDMTEKLFTGTLSKNETKRNSLQICYKGVESLNI